MFTRALEAVRGFAEPNGLTPPATQIDALMPRQGVGGLFWVVRAEAAGLRTRQGRAALVEGKLFLGHVCSAGKNLSRGRPANRSQASTDAAAEYWVRPPPE
jgi:hypothetical protein